LTPLLDRPENKAIDLRIGFYTTSLATELSVQEMELYTETQRR